jgi:chromosome segregation ATPase
VNKIRGQLQAFDPTKADLPQTQNWYEQQEILNIEKGKLDEIAKQQKDYLYQVQIMEEKVNELAARRQSGEQGDFREVGNEISRPDTKGVKSSAEEIYEMQEMEIDEGPATQSLFDRLMQSEAQLREMTEERNTLRDKNLALAKRSAVLNREMWGIQKESKILRRQRNILQGRFDDLEDQGIDIGVPRNDLEAEARSSRKRQRDQLARMQHLGGTVESNIKEGVEADVDFFQGAMLETELQNATDEMEDETLEEVRLQKQRGSIDSLFTNGSDKASSEDSNLWSPVKEATPEKAANEKKHTSPPLSSASSMQVDDDMVYGDENSEDLIDWTEADEDDYQIDCFEVASGEPSENPEVLIQKEDPVPPMSPAASPTHRDSQDYEEKLPLARAECDLVKQQTNQALAELELTRRDLATRTAERNGARQRMQLLDEEIAERETREIQLKEELRLAREEDPLADKLFVELHELRTAYEAVEERRAAAEDEIKELQLEMYEAEAKGGRDLERIKQLESVVEWNNGLIENLERQLGAANSQLSSMSAGLNARQVDVQRIAADLQTARNDFERALTSSKAFESCLTAIREEKNIAQVEVKSLAEKLRLANGESISAKAEVRDLARENEKAVAAANTANEVAGDLRRSLNASNDMGHRLRRISGENTRELVMVRDERDSALHDISKLTRDLATSHEELGRLRASLGTLIQERGRAQASLLSVTNERDHALKEVTDLSEQLQGQKRQVDEHIHSVRMFSDENEKLLAAQEDLKRQIRNLLAAREHHQASEGKKQNMQIEAVQNPKPAWIDTTLHNLQQGGMPKQPGSPTLFVNNTPVTAGLSESIHAPAPVHGPPIRKSTRSTRNPAPTYVEPPSPSTPKQIRKWKNASRGKRGSTKKMQS